MYQQSSRQPRPNSSNMQQRGGNLPQQPRQQPQQQQQMAIPMVPPMNQQQFTQVYQPYQQAQMYPYAAMNQYAPHPQYVAMMPQAPGLMTQPTLPMQIGQQPRYQAPMTAPNRMLQPRQPHVPHQKSRSKAIPIVDPNTLQEVNLVGVAAAADATAAAAVADNSSAQQVNGEEAKSDVSDRTESEHDESPIVNGSEAEEKHENRLSPVTPAELEAKTEQFVAQDSKTVPLPLNAGPESKPASERNPKSSQSQRASKQEEARVKSPAMTPEPPASSKSPEPPSSSNPLPVSAESAAPDAEDDGDWQEAKVRSKKKKPETRPVPEKQPERQQRRKDFDKKGPKGKPAAAAPPKTEKTPEPVAAAAPPPILSYKDRLLGKKDAKKAAEAVAESKPEEKEQLVESPPAEEIKLVSEAKVEEVVEEPVKKEEEIKPEVKPVKAEAPVKAIEDESIKVVKDLPEEPKEKVIAKKEASPVVEQTPVAVKVEEAAKPDEPKEETVVKEEVVAVEPPAPAAVAEVPQIEVEPETPTPEQTPEPEVETAKPTEPSVETLNPDQSADKPAAKLYRSSSMDNLVYAEDQWSPKNLQGKKKYESDFLRKLQTATIALKLPESITLPKNIVREANREFRPIGGGGGFSFGKEINLMPSFVASFSPKRDPRMRDGMPKIVKSISLSADVKLNESENAWKPKKRQELSEDDKSELDDLLKKVRSIVNKITPEKFEKLMGQVKDLKIDTQEKLEGVINLIFLKAIDEPSFSHVYAKMCYDLSTYVRLKTDEGDGQTVISFKRLLITRCQQEYERQNEDDYASKREEELKKIEEAVGDDKKEMTLRLEEMGRKKRVRYVGVNRFIAELYQRQLLSPAIMLRCINELLAEKSEECIECLCKIVTTIGQNLEENGISLKEPIDKINDMVVKKTTGTRIRFMMQDVVDLRNNKWKPRREAVKPKTMEEIAQEAKKEAAALPPPSSTPQSTPNHHRGGTPGRGSMGRGNDNMNRNTPRPMKPMPAAPFDPKKLSGMNAEVSFGRPSFGQWTGGSSVVVTKSKNMFSVLDDDKDEDVDTPHNSYSKSKPPRN